MTKSTVRVGAYAVYVYTLRVSAYAVHVYILGVGSDYNTYSVRLTKDLLS